MGSPLMRPTIGPVNTLAIPPYGVGINLDGGYPRLEITPPVPRDTPSLTDLGRSCYDCSSATGN
jgi:hypothetical protein